MYRNHRLWMLAALVAAVVLVVGGSRLPAANAESTQLYIYRVAAPSESAAQRLIDAGFDVLEDRTRS